MSHLDAIVGGAGTGLRDGVLNFESFFETEPVYVFPDEPPG